MNRKAKRWVWLLLLCGLVAGAGVGTPASGQGLASQVLALYPPNAGEVVFVDLQAARRSPHFGQLKAQLLPERFRQVEQLAANLGVDFERNVDRVSWVFVNPGDPARAEVLGVAEGAFYLDDIQQAATALHVTMTTYREALVFVLGAAPQGGEFVFALRDNATCLFGFRGPVEAMLDRAAAGGPSLLDNQTMRALVEEVNRSAPLWLVMDGQFAQLGARQFLGEAARLPGAGTLAERVRSVTVRLRLDRGLEATITARCASSTDALWFSAFLESGFFFQRQRFASSNPALARMLSDARLERADDRLRLTVSVPESDLASLIQSRSFAAPF